MPTALVLDGVCKETAKKKEYYMIIIIKENFFRFLNK